MEQVLASSFFDLTNDGIKNDYSKSYWSFV
jgi:hypothetical protein